MHDRRPAVRATKIRTMSTLSRSSSWLFVDGLPLQYTGHDIRELFSEFGTVVCTRLQTDCTGGSLRCAYVQMASAMEVENAILQLMKQRNGIMAVHIPAPSRDDSGNRYG